MDAFFMDVLNVLHAADSIHPAKNVPYGLLYEKTIAHGNELKNFYKAHNYYEIWECDFKQQYQITQYDKDLCNIIFLNFQYVELVYLMFYSFVLTMQY